jgi:hypothetical protein
MQAKDPPQSLNQKEKAQWNARWVGLLETKVSTEPIVPKNIYVILNNIVMSME